MKNEIKDGSYLVSYSYAGGIVELIISIEAGTYKVTKILKGQTTNHVGQRGNASCIRDDATLIPLTGLAKALYE